MADRIVRKGYVYHDTLMKYDTKAKALKAAKFRRTLDYACIVVKKGDHYAVYSRIKMHPDIPTA
jgi:hypothetical protein